MLTPFQGQAGQRGQNPFAMMNQMMNQMMQPFGGHFAGGLFGGGLFGNMGQIMPGMAAGGLPGASFSCQTMSFSSRIGQDGQVHEKHYSSSTVVDGSSGVRETKSACSDSATGTQKLALERQIADSGRRVVKERCSATGEERQTDTFRGISPEQAAEFDERWQAEAAPRLPSHALPRLALSSAGSASSAPTSSRQVLHARAGRAVEAPQSTAGVWGAAEPPSFRPARGARPEGPGHPGRSSPY
mmetsp:Transcript_4801/g.13989  ORF Transcript_4801/g.13989 Transcript_4801/m.13989 type:complete len:243 (+) Transcript_4801:137-865(+)